MGVKIKPKETPKKGEAERTKHSVPMPSYGLQNPGKDSFSPSTENKTPTGTRYDYQKDQSIAPTQYDLGPSAVYKKNKSLGPMAKLHGGPGNKATGNDKNNTSDQDLSQVASAMPTIKANISRTKYIARELGLNKLTHLKDSINSYDPATKTKKLDKRKADREEKKEINRNTRKTEGTRLGQFIRKKINKIKN